MTEHSFIAIVQYNITAEQAHALTHGPAGPPTFSEPDEENPRVMPDGRANLRVEDIRPGAFAGCFDCEQPYEPGMENTECPGQPKSYDAEGNAQW